MDEVTIKSSNKENTIYILNDALRREKNILKIAIKETQNILVSFEKKFKMKTGIFYSKFNKGVLGDKNEFIEWAGEKEIIDRLKKEYKQIQEIRFVH